MGYVRRNFLVPVPSFESFDALNAYLERRCLERMDAKLRGHMETIGHRMERDLDALLPLPPVAYDACEKQAWIIPSTCSGWLSLSASIATSAWWSGGSGRPASLRSRAWTPSTFQPSPR